MELPEKLRAHANRPLPPALDQVRDFLRAFVADCESLDEVRDHLLRIAQRNQRGIRRELAAIDAVLDTPQAPGTLSWMVAADGNWVLDDDTSDAAAAAWLGDIAALIRGVLGET
ncbi:hypothetical protein [Nocardia sp. NBC_01327]|uniref:hypothetical protein n=1 Tax=Nocardia sp. NBC_01327 TaxID=2903593 RepID=UPI002E0D146D|nr:hypothetical protein OG326_38130 [Nocardia sp. NBC_01327]